MSIPAFIAVLKQADMPLRSLSTSALVASEHLPDEVVLRQYQLTLSYKEQVSL